MLLHKATQGASLLFRSSSQQLLMVAAGQDVSSALQCCAVSQLLSAVLGAQQLFTAGNQLMPARAASSGSKGRGRKKPSNAKGYDRLLSQWAHMTAKPGSNSSSKGKGQRPHAFSGNATPHHSASKPKKRKTTSASSSWYWDADMAQAAAAAQLHPDELHNLVFGGSDSSSKGSSRRQQRKATRKRAKTLRKQAAGMGAAYDGFGFAWAEGSEDARTYGAYASDDTDSDSYSDSDDDEYLAGAYSYFSPGRRASSRQQRQWDWRQAQPDWQWWTEEQEREWFQQAWQRPQGAKGNSQQQQQQRSSQRQSASSQSNNHHKAWWERFQEQRQQEHQHQQRHQQQRQQHWQQWGFSSSSGSSNGGSSGTAGGTYWQQAVSTHSPAILQYLSALGLPSNTQLHKQHLKAAFHKAAMQWHPDKHPDEAAKAAAEVRFKEAKAAYEMLVQHVTA